MQTKELKHYVAFKRIKNFACLEVFPQNQNITVCLKVDPSTVDLEENFTRDMRQVGHFGTGDLMVTLRNLSDLEKAQPLFERSYNGS